jgi:hypothetical protein
MPYEYQRKLKAIYDVIGMRVEKTPILREKGAVIIEDFVTLHYLKNKKLVILKCAPGSRFTLESIAQELERNLTKSDKLSDWWQITNEGLVMIFDIYGYEAVRAEDQKRLVQLLLKRERVPKVKAR